MLFYGSIYSPFVKGLLLILSFLIGLSVQGAVSDSTKVEKKKPLNIKKVLRKANKRTKGGNTYDATDLMVSALKADSSNMGIAYKAGLSYYHERDYKKAEMWFAKVYAQGLKQYPMSSYWLGLMMKMNGKYEEAEKQLNTFIKNYKGESASKYKRWAKTDADGCSLALSLKHSPLPLEVIHLTDSVNSAYSDVSPLLWNDTTLLYGSLPIDTILRVSRADTSKKERFVHFYTATGNVDSFRDKHIFPLFNAPEAHSGNGAYSPDKRRFYYTECEQDRKNKIHCTIFVSKYESGEWQPGEKITTEVNVPGYTATHPNIGRDGKGNEVLYYVSDRPGGKGGMDIWYIPMKKDGSFGAAKNAGSLNTDRDEATPFYDLHTDTLYFSSQGFPGMGGYDIFRVGGTLGKWSIPANVGYAINSQTDDMYYGRNDDHKSGFFVSNRPGIISIRSETCCDDIFAYRPPQSPKPPVVKPPVVVKDTSTTTVATNTPSIFVRGYVLEKGTEIKLDNSLVRLSFADKTFLNSHTTQDGQMYFFKIDFNKDYHLEGTHKGYFPGDATFNTQGLKNQDTLRQDIYLEKLVIGKAYRLRNVYYDYDKWFLRGESKKTLDTVYDIMTANPLIIVELGSHTDYRATDYYNIVLSQHRAESCVEYLLSRGIPLARLRAKGYGETETLEDCHPFADCPEAGPGDCPCHQLNRRTEFKIVGELDAPLEYTDRRYGDKK